MGWDRGRPGRFSYKALQEERPGRAAVPAKGKIPVAAARIDDTASPMSPHSSSSGQWQLPPVDTAAEARSVSRGRLLRILFWIFSIVMTIIAAGAFFLPSEVNVTRSVTMNAAPAAVFDQVQSFRKWEAWAPWFQRDRFLVKDFSGPESGAGAMMTWSSKKEGDGRIKIVAASLTSGLQMAVDFDGSGEADTGFELRAIGDGATTVTWTFKVDFGQNMARRYFGLMLPSAVGRDLDEGLANLKALLEKPTIAAP